MAKPDQLELLFDAAPPADPASGAPPDAPPRKSPRARPAPPAPAAIATPCPDPLPPGARWREVHTDQQPIGFVLLRSRRRSIGFVVADDGLRVTAPNWVTLGQIDDAVREKARWILAKLRDWHARKEQLAMAHTRWQAGGELPYLGKRIVLGLGAEHRQASLSGDADAPCDGDTLWLALPVDADQARIRDAAQAWLQQRAGAWFGARLAHFLQITGLRIRRWRLSSAATRWGSCTSDGNIMLNWRLIHFAPAIIDYVIAHELAHLREMNHSQDFWTEVGQILPGFEDAKNVLRRHDPATLPQF
ncbi:M48 family metallopeptidase [Bordetella bronchiseptica]